MQITKVTKTEIYCYHDYSFMLFDRDNIVTGAAIIGFCWAAGKSINSPMDMPIEMIKKDGMYHQILVNLLMELAVNGDEPI